MKLNEILINMIFKQFENNQLPKYTAIFGAGKNGLFLNRYLKNGNVNVDFFCDNNLDKQGRVIDGLSCISFNELCKYKNDVVVFVSPENSEEIIRELKKNNFQNVINSDFLKLARFIPCTENLNVFKYFPHIGHYYSLYPDIEEIMKKSNEIFDRKKEIFDINLNEEEQYLILNQMTKLYSSIPKWTDISEHKLGTTPLRYRYGNPSLSPADAIGLHCMLRILKPKRMIEVGSGYTSAVTLDTNEFYLNNSIKLTFIEPYANLLKSILKDTDNISLIEKGLQDVSLEILKN